MNLQNKNIILTGASSGIGLELLNILSNYDGVRVIAVARNIETIPNKEGVIFPFSQDLSNEEGVDALFEYVYSLFSKVDLFIANAGFAYLELMKNSSWNHIEDIYKLNVFSPIYSLQKLIENSSQNDKVMFVSMISAAGLVSLPGYSLYCSTKSALHHFMKTFSFEKSENIHLVNVYPVATKTSFFDKASGSESTPLPWITQDARIVACKVAKGIERNVRNVYPSTAFRLFYPIGRCFPIFLEFYSFVERSKMKRWFSSK